ncbi:MAG: histidinol dehydrogenase, partial [Clostridiales Family XIII bacterium]|nr:histidinol dehydrogenase [Clostridiales Family XIII bacterium]
MLKSIKIKKEKDLEKLINRNVDNEEIIYEVETIISKVRKNDDSALIKYTKKFDKVKFTAKDFRVEKDEIDFAYSKLDEKLKNAIENAKKNIEKFHERDVNKSFEIKDGGKHIGQLTRPLNRVGIYIPGGRAPLISTVLMAIIPAKIAGVKEIVMISPPDRNGKINSDILATAKILGVDEIYKIGGAQGIAALAYGTKSIERVDKIFGPGNAFVQEAKRQVYSIVDIDMVAGPSEILIIADESGNESYIAADMLSQAEHDPLSMSVLITTSEELAERVKYTLNNMLADLKSKKVASSSIKN